MIGLLVLLCTLDHLIQHQHTVVHFANRGEEGERHDKRKGEDKEREQEGGFCTLKNFIQQPAHSLTRFYQGQLTAQLRGRMEIVGD